MRSIAALATGVGICFVGSAANAQVTPIDPFTGDLSEGFETQCPCDPPFYDCVPGGVFGGAADLCANSAHITGGWSFSCTIQEHSGSWLYGSTGSASTITIQEEGAGASQFGSYFGTNHPVNSIATVEFFDANGDMIGEDTVDVTPCGSWNWGGWEFDVPVKEIVITGDDRAGFIMLDDMELTMGGQGCPADCNGDGQLNINDFVCFQGEWQDQTPFGDCNGDGEYDVLDFVCYQELFQAGCP